MKLNRFTAAFATLALAAFVAGCPGNPTTPPTDPKTSKKPSTEPTATASATTTNPTPTPSVKASTAATLPPTSPGPSTATSTAPSTAASTATSAAPSTAASAASDYTQVERLARPAINEGLIRDAGLLNAWNSVGPAVDLSDVQAAKDIRANAVGTLKALDNDDTQVGSIVTSFLPDVMRIDTTITSGYVSPAGGAPNAFSNLSGTKKIPIGGRMIMDDVINATMAVLVPGGLPAAGELAGLENDGVEYADSHDPLKDAFPYLVDPN